MSVREPWFATLERGAEEWARRLRLRHDSQFYGPTKGSTCGCEVCKWARRFLAVVEAANSHSRADDAA